ncbi:MAG: winged helix-turn-helix transcriptional regulator [Promethearchaeota archaeon]|nr:MAG: winged helix-turn-helix transcriptional regulator [Candidatus Lokiarchaeota archaeon]
MSLEKKREPRGTKEKENLQESSFRRLDFRPIEEKSEVSFDTEVIKEEIVEELSEIEKDVLEIAEDILKLKRYDTEFEIESEAQIQKYPIIEKLYAKCIAKLSYKKGYSKEEIFLAIRSLEEKNWIVTNERRTKLEILTNEKLVHILDFIKENPGIHARDDKIEEELEITRTPFLKHVITLERFKLIRSKKIGKTLHYFLSDVPEDYDKFKIIFLNPLIPNILEEIFKDETVTVSKMGENLDIYSGTILYHIKKLKDLNIVRSAKNKSGKKIFLINIELLKKYNDFFDEPDFSQLLKGL